MLYWFEKSNASVSFGESRVTERTNWSERPAASWTASWLGVSRPRLVVCTFALTKILVFPAVIPSDRLATPVPWVPPPPANWKPCGMSMSRLLTMLTTAPRRAPPNSAGNAPVKISIESTLRGSMISEKFELVACGSGRAVDLVRDAA